MNQAERGQKAAGKDGVLGEFTGGRKEEDGHRWGDKGVPAQGCGA